MGRFGDDKIEEVRTRADIVEIVGAHVRLRRAGRNFVGLCPFHNEKTPSFSVNAERGFFHCFGCGAGGSVFNFIMRVEGLNFPEAVRSFAKKYGVALPERDEAGPKSGERETMRQANQVAADFYAHVLWNTTHGALARDYLKSRGIASETARAFMIGFAPGRPAELAKALEKRGLRDAGLKTGLLKRDASDVYDMFRARVMFPIRDAQGQTIAFGGRVLDARMPKYINSPESPLYSKTRTLYGLCEARQAISSSASTSTSVGKDRAILVEGYFDVIALWQAGFKEAVAGCGTALTVEQLRVLSRYTKNVIACFDGDTAGRKASMRALEIFLQAGLLGRGIFIPPGYDPDTFVRERGAEAFAELADNAGLLIDYFLSEQAEEARGSIDARARAAARIAETLKLVHDPFQFDLLARKAADLVGIGEEVLRKQSRETVSRAGRPRSAQMPAERIAASSGDAGAKAEIGLVALALLRPELRTEIAASNVAAIFENERLASVLADLCGTDETHTALEQWIADRLTPEDQSRLSALAVGPLTDDVEEDSNDLEKARALAKDYITALERRHNLREVDSLRRSAVEKARHHSDPDEAAAAAQAVITLRRQRRGA
ncbi:MAG: DNA primase [Candidatus Binatus sp.]|uniref:DNA primase n=1 Tax=Candidatus Binatus sp. TaxID=2811406 RepID=UPI0027268519|nr:DNA primase [Candidatus Binatus sp.]MDO8432713.1 DNA primase [Candidatus Binatus sp.]